MKKILSRLSFGHPKHLVRPAVWTFLEDFFPMFPSVAVFFAIYAIVTAFDDPSSVDVNLLWIVSGTVIALGFVQFAVGYRTYLNRFVPPAEHIAAGRIEFVKKLRRLPLGFFSRKETGELINNFVNDFVNVQQAMVGNLTGLFSVLFSVILTGTILFVFNPPMAFAFYLAIPVTAVLLVLSMKTLARNATHVALARDQAATSLNEYLGGMKTLKSYNQTGEGFGKLKDAYRRLMESYIREESGSGSLMRLCTSLVQIGLPLMCMMGGYLLLGGNLGIVEFVCWIIIGTRILTPIVTAVSNMMMLRSNYVSACRLDRTMQEPEMTGRNGVGRDLEIAFDHVGFSYAEGIAPVLKDISFAIPQGGLTAIVGPSGSGKTTILRLVARFWDVTEGAITCNGTSISQIDAERWQEGISMVMQNVYLFNETIRENIMFGRADATEQEMIDATVRAGCHDFIQALPDGFDTVVGEGGSTLSGGEKQRISIARALLKKAPILLLDEPTASLDARNEVLVQQAVSEVVKDTTVLMIAHRLKTVRNADRILVMDKGRVAECGTHDELLEKDGVYARLWTMQQRSMEYRIER